MKTEQAYTKIMNQLEILHAENMAILRTTYRMCGGREKNVDEIIDAWDKHYQQERRNYD